MSLLSRLGRVSRRVALLGWPVLASGALAAATNDVRPAPQQFRQEIAVPWASPGTAGRSGFTLLDAAPDGTVRASDGQGWFVVRGSQLEVVPPPQDAAAGRGWLVSGGQPIQLPVPLSAVRQIGRAGEIMWLSTTNGALRLTLGNAATTELAGHDIRQIASGPDSLVLAATRQAPA